MPEMTKSQLEKTVKHYLKAGDPETARRYITNHGPLIKDYDVEEELFRFNEELKKIKPKNKEEIKDV